MFAIRMVQAVPGMALMAVGETKPFLTAGLIRASALGLAVAVALAGYGVEAIAGAGAVGELASLIYVARRLDRESPGLSGRFLCRCLILLPVGLAAVLISVALPADEGLLAHAAAAALAAACLIGLAAKLMPDFKEGLRGLHMRAVRAGR
jgi:O-antigen/teichoic acid export membrane protein